MAPSAVQHALLQCLWKTKSPLFCYWSSDNNWNRKSNYWRDCPTGSEKLSAWGLGLAWGTPMAPCIILAWGRFGNRLPISTSTWLSHPSPLHHALLPGSFFSSYTSSSSLKKTKNPCVPVIVPGWGPLIEQQKEEKKNPYCSLSMPQSWRHVITLHCFPSWWNWLLILLGEKISLTQLW